MGLMEVASGKSVYAHMEFMDWKPNVDSAQIAIPQDELKKQQTVHANG